MADVEAILSLVADGRLPPTVGLMRLAMTDADEATLRSRLRTAEREATDDRGARLAVLAALWRDRPDAVATVRRVLAQADHDTPPPDDGWAETFDRLAADGPEAAVALYALGDPGLLRAATAEVVDWLASEALITAGTGLVDVGCGIGRVAAAVAPFVRTVVATEVSAGMLAAARPRCKDHPNLMLLRTGPVGLRCLADATADLVLAVDVAPYWVSAGLLDGHIAEAARVLRPGGALVLMNVSYRGDDEADGADLARLAARHGFATPRGPRRPFTLWDGAVWRLDPA